MACENPQRAYQRATGGPLTFYRPNTYEAATTWRAYDLPCGVCILCRQQQATEWGIRIAHEAQRWETSCFVTLTYSDENLPLYGSLNYKDLTKFWKRLRHIGDLRYYAVGEYGDETQRPHYHACIFGHDFSHGRTILRDDPNLLWTNKELEKAWGLGNVSVGALNFATAQYTASYVLKKLRTGQQYVRIDEETGELIPLEQPRSFMSKNLGRDWWNKFGGHAIAHDFVVIDGRQMKPPKAYDRWLKATNEVKFNQMKQKRKEKAPKLTAQSSEQNRARARNAHARAKKKSKSV